MILLASQWSNKASFPGTSMLVLPYTATATKGYILGGANGFDANGYGYTLKENWEYDFAADTWQAKQICRASVGTMRLPMPLGDKIYFGTGISVLTIINPNTFKIYRSPVINSDWWEFNTLTNTWTAKAAFGGGKRQDTRGFMLGNKVYLGLGTSEYYSNLKSDLWSYDAAANTWSKRPAILKAMLILLMSLSPLAMAADIQSQEHIKTFWRYTPPQLILPSISLRNPCKRRSLAIINITLHSTGTRWVALKGRLTCCKHLIEAFLVVSALSPQGDRINHSCPIG